MSSLGPSGRRLATTPSLRIHVGENLKDAIVEDLVTLERYQLGKRAAAVLAAFSGGRPVSEVEELFARLSPEVGGVAGAIEQLAVRGLLAEFHPEATDVDTRWRARGWSAARDFQLATDDMPFLDYDLDGNSVDRARMAGYRESEPDPVLLLKEQVRECEPGRHKRVLEVLAELDRPMVDGRGRPEARVELTDELIQTILTVVFAFTCPGRKLRRTSPSGGARHPCEPYLVTWPGPNLTAGVYAYDSVKDCVEQVTIDPPGTDLLSGFWPPYSSVEPGAVLLIYAEFGRNMYRYREPRTFRSVLIDAGHLASTTQEVAEALGLRAHIHHGVSEDRLDALLGAELLDRGFVVGVGLTGSAS